MTRKVLASMLRILRHMICGAKIAIKRLKHNPLQMLTAVALQERNSHPLLMNLNPARLSETGSH